MAQVVNLDEERDQLDAFWSPRVVGTVNDTALKLVKVNGEFPEHMHEHEDECFLVLDGTLTIDMDGKGHVIGPGELLVVPRGTEHRPHCKGTVTLLLIEPADTVQYGTAGEEAVAAARATVRSGEA